MPNYSDNFDVSGDRIDLLDSSHAVVSVVTFGAKGDGIADDAPAFQSAVDWINKADSTTSILYIPKGTYNLQSVIESSKYYTALIAVGAKSTEEAPSENDPNYRKWAKLGGKCTIVYAHDHGLTIGSRKLGTAPYTGAYSELTVQSQIGNTALQGVAANSDSGAAAYWPIGVMGTAIVDSVNNGASATALYSEAVKKADNGGAISSLECDILNEVESPVIDPYHMVYNNLAASAIISNGGGDRSSPNAKAVSAAMIIHRNPVGFKSGIVFDDCVPTGNAICLPSDYRISWYSENMQDHDKPVAFIDGRSETQSTHGQVLFQLWNPAISDYVQKVINLNTVFNESKIHTGNNSDWAFYNIKPGQTVDGVSTSSLIDFIKAVTEEKYNYTKNVIVMFSIAGTNFTDFPDSMNPFGNGIAICGGYYTSFIYMCDEPAIYNGRTFIPNTTNMWNRIRKVAMQNVNY